MVVSSMVLGATRWHCSRIGWRTGSAMIVWSGSSICSQVNRICRVSCSQFCQDRSARLSPGSAAQAAHLWPPEPGPVQSERKIGRNVEVMWLIGRLASAHKTVVDVRRDSGRLSANLCAIRPAMPPDWRAEGCLHRHRRLQVQR